ncbi:MAG: hypothetical protein ABIT83_21920 [Massilia sp.]
MPANSLRPRPLRAVTLLTAALWSHAACAGDPIDVLRFGDAGSEAAHGLSAQASEVSKSAALGQSARRFLPLAANDWRGGAATFRLKVRGDIQNYLSVRLWGEDVSAAQATLYCDGKQLGQRQMSDVDILDQGAKYPVAPGRFHYITHPLPQALTAGKSEIGCRLRVTGPIWRYGATFATFQKPQTEPSRNFYALVVHADKLVPLDAVEGRAPAAPLAPTATADQSDVMARVRQRVDQQLARLWAAQRAPNQQEMNFLARTWQTGWSRGHGARASLDAIVAGIDAMWAAYQRDHAIAYHDPATPNPDWFGFGLMGEALKITAPQLQKELDAAIQSADGAALTRRRALEIMFADSRLWNKQHRRLYTNQSMIKDLYGIWYNNEGLIAIGGASAEPRAKLLPLFYESVGLLPWSGSENARGEPTWASAEGDARFSVSKDYYETTGKGLTKELGYVGGYGEVLDWVATIYDATRPAKGEPGDRKIRDQLVRIAQARGYFRFPHWDAHGKRAMRLESAIGWRDTYAPSDIMYAQKPSWDASPLQVALATRDPKLLGYAQQMIADNQFFASVERMMESTTLRATLGLIDVVEEYAAMKALPPQRERLPMTSGKPDFVFADEEDGVLAMKHGEDILYASLYWRANYGVSGLARVHYITPLTDRIATVALEREVFEPSGLAFTRPNNPHINGSRFTIKYPDDGDVWGAGDKQPVARLPQGSQYVAGEDNAHAGRADYYQLQYGPYLIGMNSSRDKHFELALPPHRAALRELAGGAVIAPGVRSLRVAPGSTAVVYLGQQLND